MDNGTCHLVRWFTYETWSISIVQRCKKKEAMGNLTPILYQWIGVRDFYQETPIKFMGNTYQKKMCPANIFQSNQSPI